MSCCNIYTSCSFSETQVMFYTCPKQDMSHPTCLRSWNGRDWCGSNFFQFFSYDPNITGHARMCYNMVTEVTRDRMRCFAHRELNWTAMFIACKRSWLFVKGEFCKIEILQNISIAGNIFFHCKPYQLFFFFCCCFCQKCCANVSLCGWYFLLTLRYSNSWFLQFISLSPLVNPSLIALWTTLSSPPRRSWRHRHLASLLPCLMFLPISPPHLSSTLSM